MLKRARVLNASLLGVCFVLGSGSAWGEDGGGLQGKSVVERCEFKNPGNDQQSLLAITLIDKDGNERKNIYQRLWKNYYGKEDVIDKMVLFTDFPPDAKGTGFMRWGYTAASGKMADQWLYLPQMRKIRRVTVRDPGDSFLGSDLTYGDMDERPVDADDHMYLGIDKVKGHEFYKVESTPKNGEASQYSKKISWYKKADSWDECVRVKTDYYDRHNNLLKIQRLSWQKIADDVWAWDTVVVGNVQTRHQSIFQVTDAKTGVGLRDRDFTERALKKGPK